LKGKSLIKLKIEQCSPRAKESAVVYVNGKNIVPEVYDVKERYNPFE
jgi:hypothetical protein